MPTSNPRPRNESRTGAVQGASAGGLYNIAELARRSLGCKAAVVRIFDAAAGEGQIPRAELCAAALADDEAGRIINPGALTDPLAADDLGFRFYAGIPLRTDGGQTVGVLAAVDLDPRKLRDGELETLQLLAAIAVELAQAQFAQQR